MGRSLLSSEEARRAIAPSTSLHKKIQYYFVGDRLPSVQYISIKLVCQYGKVRSQFFN
ncbi:MAG: hypothetical protein F6K30_31175 [Cyanothece sp. SIO2G6]|nr:hypothetical protein [Cyanothece sp. SIO2G6]